MPFWTGCTDSGCPTRSASGCRPTPLTCSPRYRPGMDAGLRRPRPDPRRRLGRRTDRPAGPDRLAAGHARDRPQGTPASRAQLRLTDADGLRITAFATNSSRGQLPDLELRHRRRARAEDRIRCAKDTGLTNLPLHDFDQNQIWCAIVALACELTVWMQRLALTGSDARRWESKRLRTRLFTVPATLARTGRRRLLHLADHHPWAAIVHNAVTRLRALNAGPMAAPG